MFYMFTATAANYLSKVKISLNALKKYHPEFKIYLAFADEIPANFNITDFKAEAVLKISDLDIPSWKSWVFGNSITELCTAVKPYVLSYLLKKKDCEAVLFFDPDTVAFSRLDDLLAEFKQRSILLTPHQTKPEKTLEAIVDNEVCSLRHGIYNLGFFGVKNDAEGNSFAKWWSERLYYFCRGELSQGFWMDQKWIDLVPALFDQVEIIKSSRFNVAPWNITTRRLEGDFKKGFTVDGQPLGFYHFTGFDSGDHAIMAAKYAGDNKSIKSLIDWYGKTIKNDGEAYKIPWAFSNFNNGVPINEAQRAIYRTRKDLQEAYPDPFQVIKGDCYYNWFISQGPVEYPEIFNTNQSQTVQLVPSPHFSSNKLGGRSIRYYFMKSIRHPRDGIKLGRKAIGILSREGFKGLKRRFKRG